MHRYMEGIMKKLSALVLASLPLFIISCGFWNYEAPETFSVKTKNEYEIRSMETRSTQSRRMSPMPRIKGTSQSMS